MSDVLADLRALWDTMPPPPPHRTLEVGPRVWDTLRATYTPPESTTPQTNAVSMLTGIPVVENNTLTPGGWRLLDGDGHVIEEGGL